MAKTRPLKPGPIEGLAPPDPILAEPPVRRMAIGAERGLKVVCVFYGVTLLGFVLTSDHLFGGREFGVVDVGFMYVAWGLFGGALGGLAIPMARGPMSSIPVAALIFLPLAVAVRVMADGWSDWTTRDVLFITAACLFMALLWGPLAWKRLHENGRTRRKQPESIR